jgi:hypothetical protein
MASAASAQPGCVRSVTLSPLRAQTNEHAADEGTQEWLRSVMSVDTVSDRRPAQPHRSAATGPMLLADAQQAAESPTPGPGAVPDDAASAVHADSSGGRWESELGTGGVGQHAEQASSSGRGGQGAGRVSVSAGSDRDRGGGLAERRPSWSMPRQRRQSTLRRTSVWGALGAARDAQQASTARALLLLAARLGCALLATACQLHTALTTLACAAVLPVGPLKHAGTCRLPGV